MSNRQLTPQQQRAVTTRGVAIALSAAAGSGKTTVLTERYLSYLFDDGLRICEIAAITFTERAATEMRRRIRRAIEAKIVGDQGDQYTALLDEFETATIGTIHSFCTQLLRRFAVPARIDPAFGVVDPSVGPILQADTLRKALYDLLLAPTEAGTALCDLVRCFGWPSTRGAIGDLLDSPDRSRWDEWIALPESDWVNRWIRDELPAAITSLMDELQSPGTPIGDLLPHLRSPAVQQSKARDVAQQVLDGWTRLPSASDRKALISELIQAARVQGVVTAKAFADPSDFARLRDGFAAMRETLKKIEPLIVVPPDIESAAAFGKKFLRVARECDHAFARAKARRSELDFNDQLEMARDLLRDNAAVRKACQTTYRRVLVDELQDTDPVQMEFIELLTGGDARLFAVGDAKQSIYRFRGAEVALYNQLRDRVPDEGRQSLTTNFRSQPAILDFVNALVGPAMPDYEPLVPAIAQASDEPCIEFFWTAEVGTMEVNRALAARLLAQRLKTILASRVPLVTRREPGQKPTPRPVEPGDIVLLFRSMTSVAVYEQALEDAGLDYYVIGGTAFYTRQEVFDWLDLFRALENPLDSLSLAGVLRSPFAALSDDALYRLARHPGGLWAGLRDPDLRSQLPRDDAGPTARIADLMTKWRAVKDTLRINDLIRLVLADTGYDAALQYEPLGPRKLANLWKLQDVARSFDEAGGMTLAGFVARLTQLVDTPPKEEQAATQPIDAGHVIRLMSIHQAKGLEFPLVVLPEFTASTGGSSPLAAWDPRLGCVARPPDEEPPVFPKFAHELWRTLESTQDAAEAVRVLYVATTRAMDYLMITGVDPLAQKKPSKALQVLLERFDPATGAIRDPRYAGPDIPIHVEAGTSLPSVGTSTEVTTSPSG